MSEYNILYFLTDYSNNVLPVRGDKDLFCGKLYDDKPGDMVYGKVCDNV